MPDQLRERFDALRSAVEHTDVAGLHDVRLRRTRRTRNRVAAVTAGTVAAVALGGVLVLPQLGEDARTAATGAEVMDASAESGAPAADEEVQPSVQELPGPTLGGPDPSDQPPPEEVPAGPFSVTSDSLLTWEEIQATGETGPGTAPYSAVLVFPGLCGAENAYAEYSGPVEVVAAAWSVADGVLNQAAIEYESEAAASDALARLVQDSESCPVVNEYTSILHTGSDASVGAEISFFELTLESGEDGSISTAEIAVARIANVLVEIVLNPYGAFVVDADSRSRALADASVSRVVATG